MHTVLIGTFRETCHSPRPGDDPPRVRPHDRPVRFLVKLVVVALTIGLTAGLVSGIDIDGGILTLLWIALVILWTVDFGWLGTLLVFGLLVAGELAVNAVTRDSAPEAAP